MNPTENGSALKPAIGFWAWRIDFECLERAHCFLIIFLHATDVDEGASMILSSVKTTWFGMDTMHRLSLRTRVGLFGAKYLGRTLLLSRHSSSTHPSVLCW